MKRNAVNHAKANHYGKIISPPSQAPAWEGLASVKRLCFVPPPAKREFRLKLRYKAELCNEENWTLRFGIYLQFASPVHSAKSL